MAKVINQNDLVEIINSNITATQDIIKVLSNSLKDIAIYISPGFKQELANYNQLLGELIKEDGVLNSMESLFSQIRKMNKTNLGTNTKNSIINLDNVLVLMVPLFNHFHILSVLSIKENDFENIKNNINYINNIVDKVIYSGQIIDDKKLNMATKSMESLDSFLEALANTLNRLDKLYGNNIAKLLIIRLQVNIIHVIINEVYDLVESMGSTSDLLSNLSSAAIFRFITDVIINMNDIANEVQFNLLFRLKMKIMKSQFNSLLAFAMYVQEETKRFDWNNVKQTAIGIIGIRVFAFLLADMVRDIKSISVISVYAIVCVKIALLQDIYNRMMIMISDLAVNTPSWKVFANLMAGVLALKASVMLIAYTIEDIYSIRIGLMDLIKLPIRLFFIMHIMKFIIRIIGNINDKYLNTIDVSDFRGNMKKLLQLRVTMFVITGVIRDIIRVANRMGGIFKGTRNMIRMMFLTEIIGELINSINKLELNENAKNTISAINDLLNNIMSMLEGSFKLGFNMFIAEQLNISGRLRKILKDIIDAVIISYIEWSDYNKDDEVSNGIYALRNTLENVDEIFDFIQKRKTIKSEKIEKWGYAINGAVSPLGERYGGLRFLVHSLGDLGEYIKTKNTDLTVFDKGTNRVLKLLSKIPMMFSTLITMAPMALAAWSMTSGVKYSTLGILSMLFGSDNKYRADRLNAWSGSKFKAIRFGADIATFMGLGKDKKGIITYLQKMPDNNEAISAINKVVKIVMALGSIFLAMIVLGSFAWTTIKNTGKVLLATVTVFAAMHVIYLTLLGFEKLLGMGNSENDGNLPVTLGGSWWKNMFKNKSFSRRRGRNNRMDAANIILDACGFMKLLLVLFASVIIVGIMSSFMSASMIWGIALTVLIILAVLTVIAAALKGFAFLMNLLKIGGPFDVFTRLGIFIAKLVMILGALVLLAIAGIVLLPLWLELLISLGFVVVFLGVLVLFCLAASAATPILGLGMLAMGVLMISILSIFLLVGLMMLLANISFSEKDKENINKVLDDVIGTIHSIYQKLFFSNYDENGNRTDKDYSWLGDFAFLGKLGDMAMGIFQAIGTAGVLFMSVVAVGCVWAIAGMLSAIQNIDLVKNEGQQLKVIEVIDNVLNVVKRITDMLFDTSSMDITLSKNEDKRGILDKIGDFVNSAIFSNPILTPIIGILKTMKVIGQVGLAFIVVGMVSGMAKSLSEIQNIDINKDLIIKKISLLTSTANSVFRALTEPPTIDVKSKDKSMMDIIEDMSDEDFYDKLDDYEDIIERLADISEITIKDQGFTDKALKNSALMVENHAKFVENINKVDLKKLETSTNMFKYMAEFSKSINGNFDDLTRAIAEKLMPLLNELKELLEDIPDKIEKSSADVSASVFASNTYGGTSSTYTNFTPQAMEAQVKREQPKLTKEEVGKIVDERMSDQAVARAQSITTKIDELMEMLKSGMTRVTINS